jgi:hypothetical protein
MSEGDDSIFYLKLRKNILRFAKKLDTLDNDFLKEFSQYLQETYEVDKPKYKSGGDWRMKKLDDFISHVYLLPKAHKIIQYKGCALLGKTPFDKLDFIKAFLENYGGSEYANDGITHNRYAVLNCEGKAKKAETLERYAGQYNDVPFVIFNNCENILKQEDNLRLFKFLCERDRKLAFLDTATDEFKDFVAKSWYILLGNENKMHEILEKARPAFHDSVSYRINTFDYFIRIFDFDKEPKNIPDEEFNEFLCEIGVM